MCTRTIIRNNNINNNNSNGSISDNREINLVDVLGLSVLDPFYWLFLF